MIDYNTMKYYSFLLCLLSSSAFAADRYHIAVARMFERTAADVSYHFLTTSVKNEDISFAIVLSAGIGAVRWDNDRNGEGRLHLDAGLNINSAHFSIGPFIASGANGGQGGPALGLRTTLGYRFPGSFFVGGYWEAAVGLPPRGTRAGLGIQVGISF